MFALVLGALRARPVQAVTVLFLTVLASAAATASPWYMLASARRAAVAEVRAAPAASRTLSVRRITTTSTDPRTALATFGSSVQRLLPVRDPEPVLGMTHSLGVSVASTMRPTPVAYRDDACAHLRITGSCPTAADEVVISQYTAGLLGLEPGATLSLREFATSPPVVLRVVGRYELDDPSGAYWADPLFSRSGAEGGDLDPVFVALSAFGTGRIPEATFVYDAVLPDALIQGEGGYDLADTLRQTGYRLEDAGFHLVTPAQDVVRLIAGDRAAIRRGVLVGAAQVLVLCWFALGLAGWYTARERRNDVALLKLRGATGTLRLALGQHLVPMLLGLVVGAVGGYLVARSLAGAVTDPVEVRLALGLSALAAAITVLGGLVALALTEVAALRAPVVALLRRVPAARRGWRSDVVDLLLIATAVAAVYQARSGGIGPGGAGLGLAAPTLVALAVALLVARLIGYLADRGGGRALRAGRLRWGLTALQFSRQPGTDRVFALVAVAVAVLATAAGGWTAAATVRVDWTTARLGAARVLTVQALNRTALLAAVDRADPQGREAMAVVANPGASPPVLALDASRLAAVARWRPDFGPVTALDVARSGANPVAALPAVTGSALTLRGRNDSGEALTVLAQLENRATGAAVSVPLGPVEPGEHEVSAPVRGCAGERGCRLLRLELVTAPDPDGQTAGAPPGSSLTVTGLSQRGAASAGGGTAGTAADGAADGAVLDATSLGDSRRWRSATAGLGLTINAREGALELRVATTDPFSDVVPDNRAFVVDTPLPLPIVIAGKRPSAWLVADATLNPFGGGPVPVRVAGTATALPVLGGEGVLLDLRSAQAVLADAGIGGTLQVWLATQGPTPVVDRLREAGLVVLADDTLLARQARLAEQGPAVSTWFRLLAAAAGLLLAAAALSVAATVDRSARAVDLRALRTQGLSRRAAITIGYAGYATLVPVGVLCGLVASALAGGLVGLPEPMFTDGGQLVVASAGVHPVVLGVAGLVALAVLGLTWWASVAPLRRQLRLIGGPSR